MGWRWGGQNSGYRAGLGALGWLGWVCLANMTLGWAVAVFIPTALVLIALFAPAAMAIAGLVGVLGGGIATLVTRQKNAS